MTRKGKMTANQVLLLVAVPTSTCPSSPTLPPHLPHVVVFAVLSVYTESLQHLHFLYGLPVSSETAAYLTIGSFFICCKGLSFGCLQCCKGLSSGVSMKASDLIARLFYIVSCLISTIHPLQCW